MVPDTRIRREMADDPRWGSDVDEVGAAQRASVPAPVTAVPIMLGGVGFAAFLMGCLLAVGGRTPFHQLAGLISLVVGAVLITGAVAVDAIARLRLDFWRAQQNGGRQ
jgi:hypothetical protein